MKPALASAFGLTLGMAIGLSPSAQTPAGLSLQVYAGLTISGAVGTTYSVEYVTDLANTNDQSVWRALEYLQLPSSQFLWTDKSCPATGKRFYRAVAMAAPTNMVFIPSGTFRMGSPPNEVDRHVLEGPQSDVVITRGFWMGKYEVTQAEYLAVMGNNPSFFNGNREAWDDRCQCVTNIDFGTDFTRPVERVTWYDATNYCAKLTERERMAGRIATNCVYRLPTEAEWEYACRALTSTRFSYGDDPGYENLTNYAWCLANSGEKTHPVGQKLPNAWGLYDMHGNVGEMCQDWYGYYAGGLLLDPQGSATGSYRATRNGDWATSIEHAWLCRSAFRFYYRPDYWSRVTGFRVVLVPSQP